jgi:hypothetical protein
VRRWVWSRNLVNEEALAQRRLSRQKQTNIYFYIRVYPCPAFWVNFYAFFISNTPTTSTVHIIPTLIINLFHVVFPASQRKNSDLIPDPSNLHFWLTMWQCDILLTKYSFVPYKYYSTNKLHTFCIYDRRHLSLVTEKVVNNLGLFVHLVTRTRLFWLKTD